MHIRNTFLVFLFLAISPVFATQVDQEMAQEEIDLAIAPIKSRADLEHHMLTAIDSPLDKLPPDARAAFIDSLVFTPKGLGSYSWQSIAYKLSVSDVYGLLALFGVQSTRASVPTTAPATEVEQHMVEVAPMIRNDFDHKVCVIYGPGSYICQPQGGAACSRACD